MTKSSWIPALLGASRDGDPGSQPDRLVAGASLPVLGRCGSRPEAACGLRQQSSLASKGSRQVADRFRPAQAPELTRRHYQGSEQARELEAQVKELGRDIIVGALHDLPADMPDLTQHVPGSMYANNCAR